MSEKKILLNERLEWLGANHANKSSRSDKFYQIEISWNGGRVYTETRRWGRYGTKGQSKVIEHHYEWSAFDSARSQLRKKAAKGYTKEVAPLQRLASVMEDD